MWLPDLSQHPGPAYKAIAEAIEKAIASGQLKRGSRLPTHRALADGLGVTVGTVTRGYAEAERRNLVEARVGSGTYVCRDRAPREGFLIADESAHSEDCIDLSFSTALSIDQEQRLTDTLADIQRDRALMHRLLQYHPECGMAHHRLAGKQWLEITGINGVDENHVIVSNGAQNGFFLTLLSLCQRGDTVLCDGLTYPGFIAAARQLGLRVVGLDMDAEGSTPEALLLACKRYRPRLIYLMPRLNNPTSRRMSRARIEALANICRRHNMFVLEDDTQGCLTGAEHPTFANLTPDITVLVTSCSKAMTGGLRIGFIYAPNAAFELIANGLRVCCWMVSPLMAEVVYRWITSGQAGNMLLNQHAELQIRHQLVAEAFAGYRYEADTKAFNVWLHLPEHWRAAAFTERAAAEGVLIKPAEVFAAGQYPAPQAIRLCLGGNTSRTQLQEGLARLHSIKRDFDRQTPAGLI